MPGTQPTTSQNAPRVSGDLSPRFGDWRGAITKLAERRGGQTKAAALLGTNEQAIRRWSRDDGLAECPSANEAMKFIETAWRKDAAEGRRLLQDWLGPHVQLALGENPTRAELADQIKSCAERLAATNVPEVR